MFDLERLEGHRRLRDRAARRRGAGTTDGGRCEDHRPFDDVAQLADVARPRVALQLAQTVLRQRLDGLAERLRELVDERPHQPRNVFDALAQRRHDDRKHVEPIEQIFAEGAVA